MSTLPIPNVSETPHAQDVSGWRCTITHKLGLLIGSKLSYALADQVVYSFGNMAVAALLSRHCAQREFGIYILTQRVLDVLIQICNVLLWAPFTFNLPGTEAGKRRAYQGSMFNLQIALCLAFTLALWGLARCFAVPSHTLYYATFGPLTLTAGGMLFREFTRRMYFCHMRMKEAFWTDVATVLLQIAGVEWLYRQQKLVVGNTLWMLCAGAVIVSFWWLAREWQTFACRFHATFRDFQRNLQLGRWFLGSNMVFLVSSQCNPWVLSAVLGGPAVGSYAICESVVNIPRVALTSAQNVMGPMLASTHHESGKVGLSRLVRKLDRLVLLGSSAFVFVILFAGPWLARLIFQVTPADIRVVLGLLSLNLVVYAASLAQSYGLTALDRANAVFSANGFGLVAQAGVCFFLVRRFGIPGAAAAMLLGNTVVLLVRRWQFRREMATWA